MRATVVCRVIRVTPGSGWSEPGAYDRAMSPLKAGAAAVLALATGPLAAMAPFSAELPRGVPAAAHGWELISGDLEFENPRLSVQYEFYVNPVRPAIYEVVRYRVVELGPVAEYRRYAPTEKLQWDRDGRDLRRYECVPASRGGCAWREMEKGGEEYLREVPVLLWLYGIHRRVARERAEDLGSTHLAAPRMFMLSTPTGG